MSLGKSSISEEILDISLEILQRPAISPASTWSSLLGTKEHQIIRSRRCREGIII
jgi:hypothetical protein